MGTSPLPADRMQRPHQRRATRGERLRGTALAAIVLAAAVGRTVAFRTGRHGASLVLLVVLVSAMVAVGVHLLRQRTANDAAEEPRPDTIEAMLDALGTGWQAIHGVALGREWIDHVIVGPPGAFVAVADPQLGRIDPDALDPTTVTRAVGQGEALERISGLPVRSLLVFTAGHLPDAPALPVGGVTVVPAPVLAAYLNSLPGILDAAEVAEVGEALRLALEVDATPS